MEIHTKTKKAMRRLLSVVMAVMLMGEGTLEVLAYEPDNIVSANETVENVVQNAVEDFVLKGVKYQIIDAEAKTVRIIGYTSDLGNSLDLYQYEPATIEYNKVKYTITEVADGAFANSSLKWIAFPPTIESYGSGILDGCNNLNQIMNNSSAVLKLPVLSDGSGWVDELNAGDNAVNVYEISNLVVKKKAGMAFFITFDSQGGSSIDKQLVPKDEYAKEPAPPTKEGYIFGGWSDNVNTYNPIFSFQTCKVTHNYTLYAKWIKVLGDEDVTILTDGYSGTVSEAQTSYVEWYRFTPTVSGEYTMQTSRKTFLKIAYFGTDYADEASARYDIGGTAISLEAGKTYYYKVYCMSACYNTTVTFASDGLSTKTLDSLSISTIPSQTYTGSAICPTVTIKDGTTVLTQNTDYTLSYSNNINAGTGTVTITAKGTKYTGSVIRNFTINKAAAPVNKPGTMIEVAYETDKVEGVSLSAYPNWSWKSTELTKALTAGGTTEAVAEYTGADKANYQNTTITITIKRGAPVIKDFTLNVSRKDMKGNESFQLEVISVVPSEAVIPAISWNSSNTNVATVDAAGKVTAKSTGTAKIIATINGISKECTVAVTNPVSDFTLNSAAIYLIGGKTLTLSIASTIPAKADTYIVNWSSDNTNVATVVDGQVKAGSSGKATITATINGISKSCMVTVTNPLTGFNLNKTELALKGGEKETLSITSIVPVNADAYVTDWSSNNTDIVTVTNGEVKAGSSGKATITATINGISRSCNVTVTNPVTDFTLNKTSTVLVEGNKETLFVETTVPEHADSFAVNWNSSNESVASVSGGVITAKQEGEAVITATVYSIGKTITQTCKITVEKATADLEDIRITSTDFNLRTGEYKVIGVIPVPAGAALGNVTYVSKDSNIATVDQTGKVTAKKSGETIITVSAGEFRKECRIVVTNPLTSFSLNKTAAVIMTGNTETIYVSATTPVNPDSYTIDWKSDNNSVATVDANGKVTAVASGTATITATINGVTRYCSIRVNEKTVSSCTVQFINDGSSYEQIITSGNSIILPEINGKKGYILKWKNSKDGKLYNPGANLTITDDMTFTVDAQKILVSNIVLNITNKTLKTGENFVLQIKTVEPGTAYDTSVAWSSSNTKVVTVDANGRVTAVAAGRAVIKAVAKDGSNKSASCAVTVITPEPEKIEVSSLKITGQTKKVAPGKKIALTANIYPENATNKQVTWKVSNKKYASVNSKGVVTTKKAGKGKKVTVTAVSAENNEIKAVYKITIMKNAVKKIKLTGKKTLKRGKTTTIKAKFTPSKNISKELVWTSNKPDVATVSAKGKVKAKKKGKVKITAKAKDGSGKKASITIKIK